MSIHALESMLKDARNLVSWGRAKSDQAIHKEEECLARLLMAWPEGDETNQSGSSQPCADLMV